MSCFGSDEDDTVNWSTCTNSQVRMNLPFSYTKDTSRLIVRNETDDGEVYVHLGAFGSHFNPLTGHNYGDPKSNMVGFFTNSDNDLEELELGLSAFFGGVDGSVLENLRPVYRAPRNGTIQEISYSASEPGLYLNDEPLWQLVFDMGDFAIRFDHVGKFPQELVDAVQAKVGVDINTYTGSEINILGSQSLSWKANAPLAYPQIIASEVVGYPGYYVGTNSAFEDRPTVQMEFFVVGPVLTGFDEVCVYKLVGSTEEAALQTIYELDLLNATSQRFAGWLDTNWQWRAEGSLCMTCREDTSGGWGLFERLGGWWETDEYGSNENEIFSLAWISKVSDAYNADLYLGGTGTAWLVSRRRNDGLPFQWIMEDLSVATTYYPVGEVLNLAPNEMLILWRDLNDASPRIAYQRVAFIPGTSRVFVHWGEFSDTESGAILPVIDSDDFTNSNGNTLVWYNLTWRPGF